MDAEITGGDLICEAILAAGVKTIFGYPGGAIMPLYDALLRHPLRHILVRHEANAGFAADGYARATGGVGVCIATSGPGATNLATPLASAFMDSVPVVAITGQVNSWLVGSDAFQETDVTGLLLPVTKWSTLVRHPDELAPALERAFSVAMSDRPGPVLIDVCKDVQSAPAEPRDWCFGDGDKDAQEQLSPDLLAQAATLLGSARRPAILAGHGVIKAGAQEVLRRLAESWRAPVATTLLGLSSIPEDHPLSLGMMGMHGDVHVNRAIEAADLLVAVGMRFDDRVTGDLATYAQNARVIHIEIDPAEVGKNVVPDVALICDARIGLEVLLRMPSPQIDPGWHPSHEESSNQAFLGQVDSRIFVAPQALDLIDRIADDDAIVVTDVGQHQMWEAQFVSHRGGRRLLTSGGCGAMGYSLGAAIGAKLAFPGREVWAIVGDGGFQMASPELATLAAEAIGVKVVIINNGYLGMVRQWQELFFEGRYSFTKISGPDFSRLAEAHGLAAFRASDVTCAERVLDEAKRLVGAAVVDLRVLAEDCVYPMITPGKRIGEMLVRPAHRSPTPVSFVSGSD
ncbi:MAG: biosynthetic-type acetolactate synthase large subunit [Candidatus Dormibacteria bacterium]